MLSVNNFPVAIFLSKSPESQNPFSVTSAPHMSFLTSLQLKSILLAACEFPMKHQREGSLT